MNPCFTHALVMAAGRGDRLKPLTDIIPKAMTPYRGTTLIAHSLGMLGRHVEKIHVTVGYKGAMLCEHLLPLGVASLFNTDGKPNGWWVSQTIMRYIDEPVLVLTCDNIARLDLKAVKDDYVKLGSPACMMVPVTPVPGIDGDFIHRKGNDVVLLDRTKPSSEYGSGFQVLNPSKVASIADEGGDFRILWEKLIAKKELKVSNIKPVEWYSVDTVEQWMAFAA